MSERFAGWEQGIFYIGCYGNRARITLYTAQMNKETGELSIVQKVRGVDNASFLALHPNGKTLYAAKEIGKADGTAGGKIAAVAVDPESGLLGEVTSIASTVGAHPCYVSVNEKGTALYAANYSGGKKGGNIALLPLLKDGSVAEAVAVMQHESEPGPVEDRQQKPHAHFVASWPGTPFVYAADLGMDAVVVYEHSEESQTLVKKQEASLQGGTGPRHIAFHPRLAVAYVTNELASSITRLNLDRETGLITPGETYSTLPIGYSKYNDSADIHFSSDGKFLYTSNRGHDSIAVYSVDESNGTLTPIQHISSGGELPRNFGITPDGNFLLAANGNSNNIVVFRRDQEKGTLTATDHHLKIKIPVCIRFAHQE
ncbi:lactonase family protein [Paenibacillus sp. GCM10027627]|uniref:lactonase family protein n=1 Tax=unclassified Paenibacillus TaxID=185978 RepID=UPI0036304E9E